MEDRVVQLEMLAARAGRQQKEIPTIKPRTFLVDLSDADVDRLAWHAAKAGMTMGELLKNFIGDLVDGTYSNGSDERDCANAWYDRCWFSYSPETNVGKLAQADALETFLDHWNDYQTSIEELEFRKENLGDGDITREDVAEAESWVAGDLEDLQEVMKEAECEGTLEDVAAEVLAWFEKAKEVKGDSVKLDAY